MISSAHKKPRILQVESASNIMANSEKIKEEKSREERRMEKGDTLLALDWYVGGAHTVDQTFLVLHDTEPTKDMELDGPMVNVQHKFPILLSPIMKGHSRWYSNDSQQTSSFVELPTVKSSYHHTIDFANITVAAGRYWIAVWSMVDQDYGKVGQGYPDTSAPQSYFSNLRTNPSFSCEPISGQVDLKNPRSCHGRKYWVSDPIEIEVSGGNDRNDKLVTVLSGVKDCAWWESKHPFSASNKMNSIHDQSSNPPSKEIHEAVEESISFIAFETKYILLFVAALLLISGISMIASYWRRLRIYTALANNPYLNLPTGFQRQ
jgi:hypothetical protein